MHPRVQVAVPREVYTAVQGLARGFNARVVVTALVAATGVVGMVSEGLRNEQLKA